MRGLIYLCSLASPALALAQGAVGLDTKGEPPPSATHEQDAPTEAARADLERLVRPSARALSLEAAIETGRKHAPSLRVAQAQTEVAQANRLTAKTALLPSLNGTATYLYTQANIIPRPGTTNIPRTNPTTGAPVLLRSQHSNEFFNAYQFGLTAQILLYDFNASIDQFRSTKEAELAAIERQKAAELTSDFNVRNAFFQTRATRALVNVARETVENDERHLAQVQAFVDVGTRPEIDLSQTRTDLANARVQLLNAQNDYAVAKVTLQRWMGYEGPTDFEVTDERLPPLEDEGAELDVLLARAMRERPDVVALTRELKRMQLLESAAKGAIGPAITGTTGLNAGGVDITDLRYNVQAGVQLNWPILNGGMIAQIRTARANRSVAEANLADMRLTVRLQIEQARLAVAAALAAHEASEEALQNARMQHRLAEGRYAAGVGNVIELGDAQVALTSAEAQEVQAEYNISMARAQLLSALGRVR